LVRKHRNQWLFSPPLLQKSFSFTLLHPLSARRALIF
jgi:hypothetical protein